MSYSITFWRTTSRTYHGQASSFELEICLLGLLSEFFGFKLRFESCFAFYFTKSYTYTYEKICRAPMYAKKSLAGGIHPYTLVMTCKGKSNLQVEQVTQSDRLRTHTSSSILDEFPSQPANPNSEALKLGGIKANHFTFQSPLNPEASRCLISIAASVDLIKINRSTFPILCQFNFLIFQILLFPRYYVLFIAYTFTLEQYESPEYSPLLGTGSPCNQR